MDADQRPMILDFGLACEWFTVLPNTYHGKLAGTPAYMAPEQAAGKSIRAEPRTDVYALGVILFSTLDRRAAIPWRCLQRVASSSVCRASARALELSPSSSPRTGYTLPMLFGEVRRTQAGFGRFSARGT